MEILIIAFRIMLVLIFFILSTIFILIIILIRKIRAEKDKPKCIVCGNYPDFRIGEYSNLVCYEHGEEYKKGNKKIQKIVDKFY